MLKKLKFNIKYIIINSKTKRPYRRNLVGLLNKLRKLPVAKRTKGKKYYKKVKE